MRADSFSGVPTALLQIKRKKKNLNWTLLFNEPIDRGTDWLAERMDEMRWSVYQVINRLCCRTLEFIWLQGGCLHVKVTAFTFYKPRPHHLKRWKYQGVSRQLSSEESSRVLKSLLPAGVMGQCFRTANKNSPSWNGVADKNLCTPSTPSPPSVPLVDFHICIAVTFFILFLSFLVSFRIPG